MAKSKYVAGKVVNRVKLDAADRSLRLTLTVSEGKGKFNLKASIKEMKEDAGKARTGAREAFDTQEKAKAAIEKLTKDAVEKGWMIVSSGAGRNAFSEIPMSPAAVASKAQVPGRKVDKK